MSPAHTRGSLHLRTCVRTDPISCAVACAEWTPSLRRRNRRTAQILAGFKDRRLRPLGHPPGHCVARASRLPFGTRSREGCRTPTRHSRCSRFSLAMIPCSAWSPSAMKAVAEHRVVGVDRQGGIDRWASDQSLVLTGSERHPRSDSCQVSRSPWHWAVCAGSAARIENRRSWAR